MDFHAVVEASINGPVNVVDAACLAPRQAMVRSRPPDAADTAFLRTTSGIVELDGMEVTASTDDALPSNDITTPTSLR